MALYWLMLHQGIRKPCIKEPFLAVPTRKLTPSLKPLQSPNSEEFLVSFVMKDCTPKSSDTPLLLCPSPSLYPTPTAQESKHNHYHQEWGPLAAPKVKPCLLQEVTDQNAGILSVRVPFSSLICFIQRKKWPVFRRSRKVCRGVC